MIKWIKDKIDDASIGELAFTVLMLCSTVLVIVLIVKILTI